MDPLTVDKLAAVLQEPNVPWLKQVLRVLGVDRSAVLLAEALQFEAAGGILTKDGSRRRTPGGVFFYLLRQQASPKERRRLFQRPAPQKHQAQAQGQPTALTWEETQAIFLKCCSKLS